MSENEEEEEQESSDLPTPKSQPERNLPTPQSSPERDVPVPQSSPPTPQSPVPETSSGPLPNAIKAIVSTAFSHTIKIGMKQNLLNIRYRMRRHDILSKMAGDQRRVKQVQDFFTYQIDKSILAMSSTLNQLPEENPTERTTQFVEGIPESTSSFGSRRKWNAYDTSSIVAVFSAYEKQPSRSEIMRKFNGDPILSAILERETSERCYQKVKTIIKEREK